jgi:glycosyltransferase involved in cell wall biosynthesis
MIRPLITVAVVCFNEEKQIAACLKSLLNQTLVPRLWEILVVDNASTDQTREIINQLQKKSARIRLVINPKRGIAASRNVALQQARGKYLAFTDADCQATKKWLEILYQGYQKMKAKDESLVAVGGPNIPPKTTRFYQALGIMLDSFLGSRGSVQARRYVRDRPVSHLSCANVLYEKKPLIKIGGFDESLGSIIEDEDLSYRLAKKGNRFYYIAKAIVIHDQAANYQEWAKKMFIYGKGRMWFLKKYPYRITLVFLLPILLVLTLPISVLLYLSLMWIYSFYIALSKRKPKLTRSIFSILITTHVFYGLGEIYGIFKNR